MKIFLATCDILLSCKEEFLRTVFIKSAGQFGMPTSSGTKSEHLKILPQGEVDCFRKSMEQPALTTNRVIAMLKLLLPAIAIAIIGLTFAWSQLMPEKGKFRLGEASIANVGVEGVVMENPSTMASTAKITRTKFQLPQAIQKTKPKADFP